ncbi:hypothetical protein [Flavobacterium urocaniciphilum]|uniref:Ig-like domain-containing protein n=1 Tax=Flavobacterium urocaniciphilum TaxID=1299341 RepID=A0A1H9BIY9_9FLAO|nr:hypothetical protein [Flavobacterium urocaniciphilum]SEP88875.1 hypothetical protein SAMN05444005_10343 [Flavobacterium urocaniciphilum]
MKLRLLIFTLLCSVVSWGQTNPVAQVLPYSQNFASFTGATTAYPSGWQGWTIAGSLAATYPTTAPNGNQALAGTTNTSTTAHVGDFNGKLGIMSTGSAMKTICLSINTTSNTNIQVSFLAATQRTENTRQNELGLQYRIGNTGTFTDVAASGYLNQMTPTNTTGTTSVNPLTINLTLPIACENQAEVQLRWLIRDVSGSGNRPGFSIDNVSVTGTTSSNTITTSSITGSPFCVTTNGGTAVSVPFTSTGTFTGNTYTAQLSNAAGSFASPTNIGTLVSNANSGTISAGIPANTPTGTGYRIRVISNGPAVTGGNNGSDLTINLGSVTIAPTTTQTIPVATNGTLLTATE